MPKLDCGFVEFSPDELGLMREHGICIFCDFQKTCQIRREQLATMSSWKGSNKYLMMLVSVCSECQVLGKKTYGVRGE